MRRRLRKYLPIVLIALMVQVLAPVAACWAASLAASDPLHAATICHGGAVSTLAHTGDPTDQTGQPRSRDGCCSVCSVAHGGAPVGPPQIVAATPYFASTQVVWPDRAPDLFGARTGAQARARAPPALT